ATRQSVAKDLSMLGANANQIAKYCNQHQHEAPNYEALERNISELRFLGLAFIDGTKFYLSYQKLKERDHHGDN
ncbi:MAG: plasmid mobilization relaxosome protein MobC, partial [Staphylococcus epidermidis]|nr:plasmid mobilization relaxosome protein MobC [Staphylococcus epidermidis]